MIDYEKSRLQKNQKFCRRKKLSEQKGEVIYMKKEKL